MIIDVALALISIRITAYHDADPLRIQKDRDHPVRII